MTKIYYEIDITKAPVGPPVRLFREGFDTRRLNEERLEDYYRYIEEFKRQRELARSKPSS